MTAEQFEKAAKIRRDIGSEEKKLSEAREAILDVRSDSDERIWVTAGKMNMWMPREYFLQYLEGYVSFLEARVAALKLEFENI